MLPAALAVLAAAALLTGCGDDVLTCAEVDLSCTPTYEPTFDNVFDNTLLPKCGDSGACHDSENPKGGLDLSERETAYQALLDGRVNPGEPSCSELIDRVFTEFASLRMPRGSRLDDAEACALVLWVANGALREPAPDAGPDANMVAP